jgi:predicted transcriptional regulator of viral defense system
MFLSYAEAIEEYGNAYQLSRELKEGRLFKHEDGVYSTRQHEPELSVIMKKYPKTVLTGEYAFYFHGLTNVIPEKYDLATPSKSAKLKDNRIHQIYIRDDIFPLGITEKEIEGTKIRIYDRERMLIELLRNKNKMPYDLYKEILLNYRAIINDLELWRIQEYAARFPKSKMISRALDEEVL